MSDPLTREVQAWLRKAGNDLRAARVDVDADPPLLEDAMFHCQQAAEKLFKAFLTAHGRTIRKTHDLDVLGRECAELDPSLHPSAESVADLSVFAWQFRYPGDSEPPEIEEAEAAIGSVEDLNRSIRERLKQEIE